MQVKLLFGRQTVALSLPETAEVTVIRKPPMPVVESAAKAVDDALDGNVARDRPGSASLTEIAAGVDSACIAICDITRPVPNHLFLRPMIQRLIDAGVQQENISILVATGLHRPNVGKELEELVGDPWVLQQIKVINHDATADSDHIDLGRTPTRGTPVRIDRRFVEAELRIATGLVEPHFMAGYSGGRKVISPGLAHAETIRTFHNHQFMSNPSATNCNLHLNPLHEEQLEIVKLIGGAYGLNTVIDEHRRLSMVNFGEITDSHLQAVDFITSYCRVAVDRPFATVVTSAAGYPLDSTYYQTVKGMVGAAEILAPGGNLVIASSCAEGLGSCEYTAAQKRLVQQGTDGFLESIRQKQLADTDEWQTQMQIKAMLRGTVHLYSTLNAHDHKHTGVARVVDLDQTVARLISESTDQRVAIIPEGPYVIPYVNHSN